MLFVGPAYTLAARKASAQDCVNMYLMPMETAAKAQFILQSVPGLVLLDDLGAACRGVHVAGSRMFAVSGSTLYELYAGGTSTVRGTLSTSNGPVKMAYGQTQLMLVDGANGYVLTLASNAFAAITDPDWPGADDVAYLDGFFILTRQDSQQTYVTALDDASSIDALDFASIESNPDTIMAVVVSHREVVYLGENTVERWFNYPFSRDTAATSEVGCLAPLSVRALDNSIFWIGRDANGSGIVYRDADRQAVRVSTFAVEQALQASIDLSAASAYVYQMDGQSFYCLNAPGVPATWCYEVSTGAWHKRCDLDGMGQFAAHRVTHMAHLAGVQHAFDADGKWYRLDREVYTFNGDRIKRTRISPNDATPSMELKRYSQFVLDCTAGESAQGDDPVIELSTSNDGGHVWGDPVAMPYGPVGVYHPRIVWRRLGTARDRVWRVDFDGDAPFAIISGVSA
jgi:hypothetical protein